MHISSCKKAIAQINMSLCKKENKSFAEVARFYESEFLADLSSLNVDKPSVLLRVTDHVPQIVDFIKKLVDMKHAYTTPSGCVYFDTKAYGRNFFIDNAESITTIEPGKWVGGETIRRSDLNVS
jgi:cysteinyl-tRNA synthetase